ncbi:hypothetical protein [Pajaroellobacter abortibovis]|nr:hypothetical protein [Pajaroellobacter abortibovis]
MFISWRRVSCAITQTNKFLLKAQGGIASTEYIVLIGTVGIILSAATVAVGKKLIDDYKAARDFILMPFP